MELLALLIFGSSLWMAIDAYNLGLYRSDRDLGLARTHPIAWFTGGLLLWILVFPIYLASRPKMVQFACDRQHAHAGRERSASKWAAVPSTQAPAASVGWYPDPLARYDVRWWDGSQWTEHASTGESVTWDDPLAEQGGAALAVDAR
jgi:hypothetical protein